MLASIITPNVGPMLFRDRAGRLRIGSGHAGGGRFAEVGEWAGRLGRGVGAQWGTIRDRWAEMGRERAAVVRAVDTSVPVEQVGAAGAVTRAVDIATPTTSPDITATIARAIEMAHWSRRSLDPREEPYLRYALAHARRRRAAARIVPPVPDILDAGGRKPHSPSGEPPKPVRQEGWRDRVAATAGALAMLAVAPFIHEDFYRREVEEIRRSNAAMEAVGRGARGAREATGRARGAAGRAGGAARRIKQTPAELALKNRRRTARKKFEKEVGDMLVPGERLRPSQLDVDNILPQPGRAYGAMTEAEDGIDIIGLTDRQHEALEGVLRDFAAEHVSAVYKSVALETSHLRKKGKLLTAKEEDRLSLLETFSPQIPLDRTRLDQLTDAMLTDGTSGQRAFFRARGALLTIWDAEDKGDIVYAYEQLNREERARVDQLLAAHPEGEKLPRLVARVRREREAAWLERAYKRRGGDRQLLFGDDQHILIDVGGETSPVMAVAREEVGEVAGEVRVIEDVADRPDMRPGESVVDLEALGEDRPEGALNTPFGAFEVFTWTDFDGQRWIRTRRGGGGPEDFRIVAIDTDNGLVAVLAPEDSEDGLVHLLAGVGGRGRGDPDELIELEALAPDEFRHLWGEEILGPRHAGFVRAKYREVVLAQAVERREAARERAKERVTDEPEVRARLARLEKEAVQRQKKKYLALRKKRINKYLAQKQERLDSQLRLIMYGDEAANPPDHEAQLRALRGGHFREFDPGFSDADRYGAAILDGFIADLSEAREKHPKDPDKQLDALLDNIEKRYGARAEAPQMVQTFIRSLLGDIEKEEQAARAETIGKAVVEKVSPAEARRVGIYRELDGVHWHGPRDAKDANHFLLQGIPDPKRGPGDQTEKDGHWELIEDRGIFEWVAKGARPEMPEELPRDQYAPVPERAAILEIDQTITDDIPSGEDVISHGGIRMWGEKGKGDAPTKVRMDGRKGTLFRVHKSDKTNHLYVVSEERGRGGDNRVRYLVHVQTTKEGQLEWRVLDVFMNPNMDDVWGPTRDTRARGLRYLPPEGGVNMAQLAREFAGRGGVRRQAVSIDFETSDPLDGGNLTPQQLEEWIRSGKRRLSPIAIAVVGPNGKSKKWYIGMSPDAPWSTQGETIHKIPRELLPQFETVEEWEEHIRKLDQEIAAWLVEEGGVDPSALVSPIGFNVDGYDMPIARVFFRQTAEVLKGPAYEINLLFANRDRLLGLPRGEEGKAWNRRTPLYYGHYDPRGIIDAPSRGEWENWALAILGKTQEDRHDPEVDAQVAAIAFHQIFDIDQIYVPRRTPELIKRIGTIDLDEYGSGEPHEIIDFLTDLVRGHKRDLEIRIRELLPPDMKDTPITRDTLIYFWNAKRPDQDPEVFMALHDAIADWILLDERARTEPLWRLVNDLGLGPDAQEILRGLPGGEEGASRIRIPSLKFRRPGENYEVFRSRVDDVTWKVWFGRAHVATVHKGNDGLWHIDGIDDKAYASREEAIRDTLNVVAVDIRDLNARPPQLERESPVVIVRPKRPGEGLPKLRYHHTPDGGRQYYCEPEIDAQKRLIHLGEPNLGTVRREMRGGRSAWVAIDPQGNRVGVTPNTPEPAWATAEEAAVALWHHRFPEGDLKEMGFGNDERTLVQVLNQTQREGMKARDPKTGLPIGEERFTASAVASFVACPANFIVNTVWKLKGGDGIGDRENQGSTPHTLRGDMVHAVVEELLRLEVGDRTWGKAQEIRDRLWRSEGYREKYEAIPVAARGHDREALFFADVDQNLRHWLDGPEGHGGPGREMPKAYEGEIRGEIPLAGLGRSLLPPGFRLERGQLLTERRFDHTVGGIPLSGKFDIAYVDAHGVLHLRDTKTTRWDPRKASLTEQELDALQMRLYAMWLLEQYGTAGLPRPEVQIHIDYTYFGFSREITLTDKDIERTQATLAQAHADLHKYFKMGFPAAEKEVKACKWCPKARTGCSGCPNRGPGIVRGAAFLPAPGEDAGAVVPGIQVPTAGEELDYVRVGVINGPNNTPFATIRFAIERRFVSREGATDNGRPIPYTKGVYEIRIGGAEGWAIFEDESGKWRIMYRNVAGGSKYDTLEQAQANLSKNMRLPNDLLAQMKPYVGPERPVEDNADLLRHEMNIHNLRILTDAEIAKILDRYSGGIFTRPYAGGTPKPPTYHPEGPGGVLGSRSGRWYFAGIKDADDAMHEAEIWVWLRYDKIPQGSEAAFLLDEAELPPPPKPPPPVSPLLREDRLIFYQTQRPSGWVVDSDTRAPIDPPSGESVSSGMWVAMSDGHTYWDDRTVGATPEGQPTHVPRDADPRGFWMLDSRGREWGWHDPEEPPELVGMPIEPPAPPPAEVVRDIPRQLDITPDDVGRLAYDPPERLPEIIEDLRARIAEEEENLRVYKGYRDAIRDSLVPDKERRAQLVEWEAAIDALEDRINGFKASLARAEEVADRPPRVTLGFLGDEDRMVALERLITKHKLYVMDELGRLLRIDQDFLARRGGVDQGNLERLAAVVYPELTIEEQDLLLRLLIDYRALVTRDGETAESMVRRVADGVSPDTAREWRRRILAGIPEDKWDEYWFIGEKKLPKLDLVAVIPDEPRKPEPPRKTRRTHLLPSDVEFYLGARETLEESIEKYWHDKGLSIEILRSVDNAEALKEIDKIVKDAKRAGVWENGKFIPAPIDDEAQWAREGLTKAPKEEIEQLEAMRNAYNVMSGLPFGMGFDHEIMRFFDEVVDPSDDSKREAARAERMVDIRALVAAHGKAKNVDDVVGAAVANLRAVREARRAEPEPQAAPPIMRIVPGMPLDGGPGGPGLRDLDVHAVGVGWGTPGTEAAYYGYICLDDSGRVLLHHTKDGWTLPRAAIGEDEHPIDTAMRGVREGTGVRPTPPLELVDGQMFDTDRATGITNRGITTNYFLGTTHQQGISSTPPEGTDSVIWATSEQAKRLLGEGPDPSRDQAALFSAVAKHQHISDDRSDLALRVAEDPRGIIGLDAAVVKSGKLVRLRVQEQIDKDERRVAASIAKETFGFDLPDDVWRDRERWGRFVRWTAVYDEQHDREILVEMPYNPFPDRVETLSEERLGKLERVIPGEVPEKICSHCGLALERAEGGQWMHNYPLAQRTGRRGAIEINGREVGKHEARPIDPPARVLEIYKKFKLDRERIHQARLQRQRSRLGKTATELAEKYDPRVAETRARGAAVLPEIEKEMAAVLAVPGRPGAPDTREVIEERDAMVGRIQHLSSVDIMLRSMSLEARDGLEGRYEGGIFIPEITNGRYVTKKDVLINPRTGREEVHRRVILIVKKDNEIGFGTLFSEGLTIPESATPEDRAMVAQKAARALKISPDATLDLVDPVDLMQALDDWQALVGQERREQIQAFERLMGQAQAHREYAEQEAERLRNQGLTAQALALRSVLRKHRGVGGRLRTSGNTDTAREAARQIEAVAPESWIRAAGEVRIEPTAGRPQLVQGIIFTRDDISTAAFHEFIHVLEKKDPEIGRTVRAFIESRVRRHGEEEVPTPLSSLLGDLGFGPEEVAFRDKAKDYYAYKIYDSIEKVLYTTGNQGTNHEILSQFLEYLFGPASSSLWNPDGTFNENNPFMDREELEFVLGFLFGYLLEQ